MYTCADCGMGFGNMADAMACCSNNPDFKPKSARNSAPGTQKDILNQAKENVLEDEERQALR